MTAEATVCAHWWVCEPPNGPTSAGTCKHCGTTRTFCNSPESEVELWGTTTVSKEARSRGTKGGAKSKAQTATFYADITAGPGVWWS